MISISNLNNKKPGKSYIFSDLNLNFEEKRISGNVKNSDIAQGIDLVIDTDLNAIKNSITNLLFQRRFLSNLNINLNKHIGEPISEMRGIAIGDDIQKAIFLFEPRAKVQKIYIGTNTDQNLYYISINLIIVNFSQNVVTLNATFNNNGSFDFINN
jgi:phage baseplate assembly protein W